MLLNETVQHAGATLDFSRHAISSGYAVSEHEERSGHWDVMSVTLRDIDDWIVANADLFRDGKKVGAWADGGTVWLDPVTVFPNTPSGMQSAMVAAVDHNQKAIFHLDTFDEIPTGGTGEVMSKSNHPKRQPDVVMEPSGRAIMAWIEAQRKLSKAGPPCIGCGDRLPPRPASLPPAGVSKKAKGDCVSRKELERVGLLPKKKGGGKTLSPAELRQRRDAARKKRRKGIPKGTGPSVADIARGNALSQAAFGIPAHLVKEEPQSEEFTISKTDNDKQLVFGWAYVSHDHEGNEVVDKSGDYIEDPWELEEAAYRFVMHSRQGGQDHARDGDSPVVKSTMVESMVFTAEKAEAMGIPPGVLPTNAWWCGFKVEDPTLWQGVKDGRYTSFSIHGSGVRHPVES